MNIKPLALAAAAAMVGALSFGSAEAATVMTGSGAPAVATTQDSNIQNVSHRYWRHRNRYRSGVFLGLGVAPFLGNGYYGSPYYYDDYDDDDYYVYAPRRSSRHVRWCLNRYQTYNIRTNTFRGYDGDLHRCRSPYRY